MIHVVIMAGGSGTRFWPASTKADPKQFLAIGSTDSMLSQTAQRVLSLCGWEGLHVVASDQHAQPIRGILPQMPKNNLIVEPSPRNTAPAIGLSALEVSLKDPQGVLVVLPADHIIKPAAEFQKLIKAACEAARAEEALVTLGVVPTRPETGYGYICSGEKVSVVAQTDVFRVEGFREKPDRKTAQEYLKAGNYYWNSGMFVFSAQAILNAIEAHMPRLSHLLTQMKTADEAARRRVLEEQFPQVEAISIDYAVMEKATNIRMLPCNLSWNDVGSWAALPDVLEHDAFDNVCLGDTLLIDSRGCVIQSNRRLVACVGMEDVIVVETDKAVLVCPKDRAQDVKKIVETLKEQKRDELL